MESSGGERALLRKSSKSKLSKQDEIEAEEPPKHRAAKSDACNNANVTTPVKRIEVPETRVESFEKPDLDPKQASKLVRSHAMCGDDDTKLSTRSIEKQTSSKSGSATSSLSRDSSSELYTDSTGINLEDFIVKTLHKNPKDRTMLMELEKELLKFAQQPEQVHRFPPMSSYNRMLVHRVAAFFGMDHNVDQLGSAVVVTKTDTSRIPEFRFADYITGDRFSEDAKRPLKRDVQSYEDQVCSGLLDPEGERRKVRSFEERVDSTERCAMYNQDSTSSAEVIESPISYSTSGYSSDSVHVQTGSGSVGGDFSQGRPWSSTDSASLDVPHHRQPLAQAQHKAGSFGGMPSLYRTSVDHQNRPPNRRSHTAEASRDMGMVGRPACIPEGSVMSPQPVVFAVASVDQVPPGAVILNQQPGQPYIAPDGTWYAPQPHPPQPQFSPAAGPVPQLSPCSDGGLAAGMQNLSMSYSPRSYSPSTHPQMYYMMPQSASESQSFVMHVPPYSGVQYASSVQYCMPSPPMAYTQASDTLNTQVTYSSGGPSQPLLIMLPSGQSTPSETSSAPAQGNLEGAATTVSRQPFSPGSSSAEDKGTD